MQSPASRSSVWLRALDDSVIKRLRPRRAVPNNESMDLFPIAKNSWSPGDTREVEQSKVRKEIGMEYDSYRRVYLADGHEWTIAGQIAREDGKKYYILECIA